MTSKARPQKATELLPGSPGALVETDHSVPRKPKFPWKGSHGQLLTATSACGSSKQVDVEVGFGGSCNPTEPPQLTVTMSPRDEIPLPSPTKLQIHNFPIFLLLPISSLLHSS